MTELAGSIKGVSVCVLVVVMQRTAHKMAGSVKCFMYEEHLSEKAGISCICTHRVPTVLLPPSFLNFLHLVFVMAGCLFSLVGSVEDIGQFS